MIELANGEKYVTYLKEGRVFDINEIHTIIGCSSVINKPDLAFWGSPINSVYDWKSWASNADGIDNYDWNNPIYWSLKKNTKVLRIDYQDIINHKYLDKYCINPYIAMGVEKYNLSEFLLETVVLDFNKLLEDDIKAVELMDGYIGHGLTNEFEEMFNSWDCESIVVLDESVICFEE